MGSWADKILQHIQYWFPLKNYKKNNGLVLIHVRISIEKQGSNHSIRNKVLVDNRCYSTSKLH